MKVRSRNSSGRLATALLDDASYIPNHSTVEKGDKRSASAVVYFYHPQVADQLMVGRIVVTK